MSSKKQVKPFMMMASVLAAVVLSGCTANRVSLADSGRVSLESQSSETVDILWSDVYQEDGQTLAYGVLKQPKFHRAAVTTHIDVAVRTADGATWYETVSEDLQVPRNRLGKGPDWKRFSVPLPEELPAGAQVSLRVHSGGHDAG